jgi:hypothetical protein
MRSLAARSLAVGKVTIDQFEDAQYYGNISLGKPAQLVPSKLYSSLFPYI